MKAGAPKMDRSRELLLKITIDFTVNAIREFSKQKEVDDIDDL